MTWMYKAKRHREPKPERCQRCHGRAPTEEIRMLWTAREVTSADAAQDWWLCTECAAEFRRGAPPTS
jgi:uncharacterized protein with PIN domain